MTNEQILKAAIEKAEKNGYESGIGITMGDPYEFLLMGNTYFSIVFSHSFAKAFWQGEKCNCEPDIDNEKNLYHQSDCSKTTPDWRYHLQTMILEEEPLQYLAKML